MANRYAQQISQILTPVVGRFMGEVAVRAHCKALNIDPEAIGPQHLEPLAKRIEDALEYFGAGDRAAQVAAMIRQLRQEGTENA